MQLIAKEINCFFNGCYYSQRVKKIQMTLAYKNKNSYVICHVTFNELFIIDIKIIIRLNKEKAKTIKLTINKTDNINKIYDIGLEKEYDVLWKETVDTGFEKKFINKLIIMYTNNFGI